MVDHCLELQQNPVLFDSVGAVTNVFFDESNYQVYTVRSGGETGVVVKGPTNQDCVKFCLKDRGPLISVKFSLGQKVLALQRSEKSVEFSNFNNGSTDPIEYSQTCKGRDNKILTFNWVTSCEIVFTTQHGVELYQVNADRKLVKLVKNFPYTINWSIYSHQASVLLISTSPAANLMVPFQFKNGQVNRLPKLEIDSTFATQQKTALKLLERNVTLLNLYGNLYVGVLRHPLPNSADKCHLDLYRFPKDGQGHVRKAYILHLNLIGRFAFNVVDNLVVAHHQPSKTSMVFDIKLPGISRSNIVVLQPVFPPCPIKPFTIIKQGFDVKTKQPTTVEKDCALYAQTWIVFQPDVIIDAALGCMWYLQLQLHNVVLADQGLLLDFLLLRSRSKRAIIALCQRALENSNLSRVSIVFSKLNQVYKDFIDASAQGGDESKPTTVFLDQNDVYSHVLAPLLATNHPSPHRFKVAVIMDYLKSLDTFKIQVQQYIYELLIKCLVRGGGFFHLQQLFRHRIIEDSKSTATLLLALESEYPPGYDIAIDMLKRITSSDKEIIDVMLERSHVLCGLRYVRSVGMLDLVPARDFLEAAMHDDMLFYHVYKLFEARNVKISGKPEFTTAENCDEYMLHYVTTFASDVLENPGQS